MRPSPDAVSLVDRYPAYLASQSLLGRYCQAVLRFDLELFASCWAVSAQWSIPGEGAVSGQPDIVRTFADIRSTYQQCMQHVVGNTIEVLTPSTAQAVTQVRELQWLPDGTASELIGVYHDDISIVGSADAVYSRRDFELIYSGPVSMPGRLRKVRAGGRQFRGPGSEADRGRRGSAT